MPRGTNVYQYEPGHEAQRIGLLLGPFYRDSETPNVDDWNGRGRGLREGRDRRLVPWDKVKRPHHAEAGSAFGFWAATLAQV